MVAAAVIGGVATLGGAAVSASASSKASKAASKAASTNNALQERIYNENRATLDPYVQAGNRATPAIQALLGLGGTEGVLSPSKSPSTDWSAYVTGNPDILADYQRFHAGEDIGAYGQNHYNLYGQNEGRDISAYTSGAQPQPAALSSGQGVLDAQNAAFENFRNSTGYQDSFAEGQRAVTSAYSRRGLLDSGAAMKALAKYGAYQSTLSFGDYLSRLVQQQGVGAGAATALTGNAQNFANATSANNNSAAQTQGQAALANAGNINGALQSGLSTYALAQGLKSSYSK
ncbi:hypothetical protein [Sphingobium phenoxybenzoativorans]|uniref:hypothetical protein n=1 Tax=Sphingobium phenoxybenzoativorans TaxID=1592790 RepID=UPI000872E791|nr:hypothetical protein [Sphingobium phenoxybenzoativorans]